MAKELRKLSEERNQKMMLRGNIIPNEHPLLTGVNLRPKRKSFVRTYKRKHNPVYDIPVKLLLPYVDIGPLMGMPKEEENG